MLTAQDMSYDEARNLHSKWQKHQAFMAELASNKDWLDKIDKVSSLLGLSIAVCINFMTKPAETHFQRNSSTILTSILFFSSKRRVRRWWWRSLN